MRPGDSASGGRGRNRRVGESSQALRRIPDPPLEGGPVARTRSAVAELLPAVRAERQSLRRASSHGPAGSSASVSLASAVIRPSRDPAGLPSPRRDSGAGATVCGAGACGRGRRSSRRTPSRDRVRPGREAARRVRRRVRAARAVDRRLARVRRLHQTRGRRRARNPAREMPMPDGRFSGAWMIQELGGRRAFPDNLRKQPRVAASTAPQRMLRCALGGGSVRRMSRRSCRGAAHRNQPAPRQAAARGSRERPA